MHYKEKCEGEFHSLYGFGDNNFLPDWLLALN